MMTDRAHTFVRGDPAKTHEQMLELMARQQEIEGLADWLTTPAMLVTEMAHSEDVLINGELERYLPGRLPGAG